MPKNRKFVNPLTRPSETEQEDTSTSTDTYTKTSTYTTEETQPSKKKEQTFEQTHERMTLWVDKKLKRRFERLAEAERSSKTALLNEAITDLLGKKYQSR